MIQQKHSSKDREPNPSRIFFKIAYEVMFKENYLNRVKKRNLRAQEGNENTGLLSLLIAHGKNFGEFLSEQEKYQGTTSLDEVLAAVASEEEEDGAYVLDGMNISNKVIFDSMGDLRERFAPDGTNDDCCIRQRKDTKQFLERHFPDDFRYVDGRKIDFGTKTSEAGALGLIGEGRKVYMVKQTAYDGTNTGKTFMCGENGVEQEFFLLKTEDRFDSDFYFDDGIVGVVKMYAHAKGNKRIQLTGTYVIKPAELAAYVAGKGSLHLHRYDEWKLKTTHLGEMLLGSEGTRTLNRVYAPQPKKIA